MRPFPPIAKTALIFYLVFAGVVLLFGSRGTAIETAGSDTGAWRQITPRSGMVDMTETDSGFRAAWLKQLQQKGYALPKLFSSEESRLEQLENKRTKLRWIRNHQELRLPPSFSEENLVKLGLVWKEIAVSQGLMVEIAWELTGQELILTLDGKAVPDLSSGLKPVPVEQLTLIQPLAGNRRTGWNWRGLINETRKIKVAPRPSLIPRPLISPSPRIAVTPPFTPIIKRRARVALIIDDVGYDRSLAAQFLEIQTHLTWSVLPFTPYAAELSAAAKQRGFEVLLHLPLEPLDRSANPGAGLIRAEWSEAEILRQLDADLAGISGATGVNNHMGSAGTADERLMDILLREFKRRGLFFIDSYTNSHSVASQYAVKHSVPHAVNQLFIDNINDVEYKKDRLRLLIQRALKNGAAIGIGHIRPGTAQAIREMLPEFARAGVEIVPVSQLVK